MREGERGGGEVRGRRVRRALVLWSFRKPEEIGAAETIEKNGRG